MLIYLIIAAALVLIDFLIKAWVTAHIPLGESQQLIPGVIDLTHIRNTGAAFSMFEGKHWFFYITTLLAFGVVAMLWRDSLHKPIYRLGLTLITAGAIGNFIDRLRFQYVTDMFHLEFLDQWRFNAIFNFADMCITFGVILVLIFILFDHDKAVA
ncbi:signal peptidase II [Lactobacillus paracasei]|uniref:signal peptidase II n=2 Tax=Lacticaseibacillus paracasei TaxID=1597 RepID=UPI000D3C3260|nr:signal peptidase II [Lacticaseibacillus paracasei]PTS59359.1 signal peptidase II [Lactobacillus sp. DS22_6]MBS6629691.1 signal peptidase II [Lacticaseibacillus paracasei]MBX4165020.1 signal peptidase II [Lacticaseibacillus paracasei]MCZ2751594.1 signal peptidase II [Lacticaseibacillus paracasei]MCZ2762073.1 signal peptidase II [Lacticaseibacillus paracasei]